MASEKRRGGLNFHKSILLIAALLLPDTLRAEFGLNWETVLTLELGPGVTEIYSINQKGLDIGARVLEGGVTIYEQEGPDRIIGSEIIVLENTSSKAQDYIVQVSPVREGLPLNFELVRWQNPSNTDVDVAKKISSAHQLWNSKVDADEALSMLRDIINSQSDHELSLLATIDYANALLRSGNIKSTIDFTFEALYESQDSVNCSNFPSRTTISDLSGMLESGQNEIAIELTDSLFLCPTLEDHKLLPQERFLLSWLLAESVRQAEYLEVAHAIITRVTTALEEMTLLAKFSAREQKWLQANINISHGTILVLLGKKRGDDSLILRGGELFRESYRAYREDSDIYTRARLIDSLAAFYTFYFNRTNSTSPSLLSRAEDLYNQSRDRRLIGAMRNNQADSELGKGNLGIALQLYLEALDILASSKHIEGRAHVRARLGYLYYILGDYSESISRYKEVIQIYESDLRLEQKLIRNRLELASVYRAAAHFNEAMYQLEQVSSILESSDNPGLENRLRLETELALTFLDLNDIESARTVADDSKDLLALNNEPIPANLESAIRLQYRLEHAILQTKIAIANSDFTKALQFSTTAIASITEDDKPFSIFPESSDTQKSGKVEEPLQFLELVHLKLVAYSALGRTKELLQEGRYGLEIIESVRDDINFLNHGAQWLARTKNIRDMLISTYISEYEEKSDESYLIEAFNLIQSVKARSLRESRKAGSIANSDDSLVIANEQVKVDTQALINAELIGASSDEIKNRKSILDRSQENLTRLSQSSSISSNSLSNIDIFELQRKLDPESIALIYSLGESKSYLIGISASQGITISHLPGKTSLDSLVSKATQEIRQSNSQSDFQTNHQLSTLILPQSIIGNHRNLIIEADGSLHRASFSTLLQLNSPEILRNITHTPSISEFYSPNSKKIPQTDDRHSIAIFANPSVSLNFSVFDSMPDQFRSTRLAELPYTLREASVIENIFKDSSKLSFIRSDATISNLKTPDVRNARILHIASHGFASEDDSEFLGLALAENNSSGESGLLTAHEVSQLKFSNELVVIGACNASAGKSVDGEGIISISRTFLANGAAATISTLWPVQDRANFEFMQHFYIALVNLDLSPSHALVYAQNKLRESSSRFGSPKHWGAYVLEKAHHSLIPAY